MSGSDAENRLPGQGSDPTGETGRVAPRATVVPYDQMDWADKLRQARAKREEVMQQRGASGQPARLVRPEARPPLSPPAGELPAGFETLASAPAPRETDIEAEMPTGRRPDPAPTYTAPTYAPSVDPAPGDPAPTYAASADPASPAPTSAARRAEPMAQALRRISGRGAGADDAPPATRDRRPGVQVLAAFAMGLGVGVPLAAVAWFLVDRAGTPAPLPAGSPQIAAVQSAQPLLPGVQPDPPGAAAPQAVTTSSPPKDPAHSAAPRESLAALAVPAPLDGRTADAPAAPTPAAADTEAQDRDGSAALVADADPVPVSDPAAIPAAEFRAPAPSDDILLRPSQDLPLAPAPDPVAPALPPSAADQAAGALLAGLAADPPDDIPADPNPVASADQPDSGVIRPASRPSPETRADPIPEMAGPLADGNVIGQGSQIRVYAPSRVPSGEMSAVAADLRQSGARVIDPVRTRLTIQDTHVRYYHASDAEAARAIAARVGAQARDFTSYSPSPPAGMLELWLAGRGAGTAPRGPQPGDGVAQAARDLGSALSRLFSSIPPSDPQ